MYKLEKEIELINDKEVRDLVKKCIEVAPEYFWKIPSSSTGKYHPEDERGESGEVLHTRRVVKISNDLCRNFGVVSSDRDCVLAAAIMHDFMKNGYPDMQERTVPGHGALWINLIDKIMTQNETVDSQIVKTIGYLIGIHMGKWDMPFFIATDIMGIIIQIADYISSRNYVKIEI